jgi:signal transduction histidine kinase
MQAIRSLSFFPAGLISGLLALDISGGRPAAAAESKTAGYLYEDTRQLVELVESAAKLVEQQGPAAFAEFKRPQSRWFNEDYYFFVYDPEGTCLFHPIMPSLVGQNLSKLVDMNGKPMIRMIADVAKKPGPDAGGWVFYLWEEQTQLIPKWKSSYIRKVIGPDTNTYLVGSGIYDIKIERKFIEELVGQAAEALQQRGPEEAFRIFRDPSSQFYFLDTYVFVMDLKGVALVDPSYPTLTGRDFNNFQDTIGNYPIRELIVKLRDHDSAWIQYMWPRPGSALPSRKLLYARKVVVNSQSYIVGSDFFLANPIWLGK